MWTKRIDKELQDVFSRFSGEKKELIPLLQDVQDVYGYLPKEAMKAVARFVSVSESQVYGVATFYAQFYFTRQGKHKIKICYGTACHVKGATRVLETFERQLGIDCGSTTEDYQYSMERVACVGSCALAPVVVADESVYGQVEPAKVKEILENHSD